MKGDPEKHMAAAFVSAKPATTEPCLVAGQAYSPALLVRGMLLLPTLVPCTFEDLACEYDQNLELEQLEAKYESEVRGVPLWAAVISCASPFPL